MLVGIVALVVFGFDLPSEPHFADESAYFTQSYYTAFLANGRRDDPVWLEYPAYDLPPLPKYLIGSSLWLGGYRLPRPVDAFAWYRDTSVRFDPPGALTRARLPMVALGAIGCVAVYGLGCLAAGRGVGFLGALLLVANPLYRLHARRAMSDVPCEAFLLVGLFAALWVWKRCLSGRTGAFVWAGAVYAGAAVGLSALSKLSGTLALIVVAAWAILSAVARAPVGRQLVSLSAAVVLSLVCADTFVALDPFLTARPDRPLPPGLDEIGRLNLAGRVRMMFALRFQVSAEQKLIFPHNALSTPAEKLATAVVQGFGRFGPFGPSHSDSTRRFDPAQDWGAALWAPLVAAGVVWSWRLGGAQSAASQPPTAWALLTYFGAAFLVVTAYLPMAWDRYLIAIQAPASLMASGAVAAGFARLPWFSRRRGGAEEV